MKRFRSIIPLSREHHYALIVCLRIHRGVPEHAHDDTWLREQTRKAIRFFETSLVAHFEAEETLLFPAMENITEAASLVTTLLEEHREITNRAELLRQSEPTGESSSPGNALIEWADLLEQHIRKEERQLFPLYEEKVAPDIDAKVGQEILKLIGTALQPKNPELLK